MRTLGFRIDLYRSASLTHTLHRDHKLNDFPVYEHGEWTSKRVYAAETRALTKGTKTKVIALYTGIFLEMALEPYRE